MARTPPRVRIVTDSTAALPAALAAAHEITIVPLQVHAGARSGAEGVDVLPSDVVAALRGRWIELTTSQPAPEAFATAYAAAAGSDIVSVHMSAALSGTCAAARTVAAALERPPTVEVVDSRSTAMGLGFVVLAAARAAAAGGSLAEVTAEAQSAVLRTSALFYVDTLEFLRRGGRIGAAAALFGTALSVKPLLHVTDGVIAPLEKVRTATRALARLQELVVARIGDSPADIAVHHLGAPQRAADLAAALRGRAPTIVDLHVTEIGAVVGAHTGPGLLGVVVYRRNEVVHRFAESPRGRRRSI